MTITCSTKGVWILDDAYKKIESGRWIVYDGSLDPGSKTLWAWGINDAGALGDNSTIPKSSPIQIPGIEWASSGSQISSWINGLSIKTDGTLWGWGCQSVSFSGIGDNTSISKSSPVQIPGTQWSSVSVGNGFAVAKKIDGTLWSWGLGSSGQLGDGTTLNKSSPVQIPGNDWNDFDAGDRHVLSTKTDGTLWAWGSGANGRVGDGTVNINRSSPVQIPGVLWSSVSAGCHSAATKTDGTVWTWGSNYWGQLGDNSRIDRASPRQVPGTEWNFVTVGGFNTQFKKTDGTLWGSGTFTGTGAQTSSPAQIPGTEWALVASQAVHSLATKNNGTLWAWGQNVCGELGDNTTIPRNSPVQIPGIWSNSISPGASHSLAIKCIPT